VKFRPALFFCVLGVVGAVEKTSLEELDSNDGEDEVEEHVDDHDVDDVLERVNDAVEHSLTTQHATNARNHLPSTPSHNAAWLGLASLLRYFWNSYFFPLSGLNFYLTVFTWCFILDNKCLHKFLLIQ